MDLETEFARCRDAGVPLILIRTADPFQLLRRLAKTEAADQKAVEPAIFWDSARGVKAANDRGKTSPLLPTKPGQSDYRGTGLTFLQAIREQQPEESVCFALGLERLWHDGQVQQALWNLRDAFKLNGRALVMLARNFKVPPDLVGEFYLINEPLPGLEELGQIGDKLVDVWGEWRLGQRERALDAMVGLSRFAAEQALSVSLTGSGIDYDTLWNQKREAVQACRALRFEKQDVTLADVGGLASFKEFFEGMMLGPERPSVIVRLEEIEKALGGSHDLSGVGMDALAVLLKGLEDNGWTGAICYGVQGGGKSLVAKALGNTYNVPTLLFDIGAARDTLVGQSEQAIRDAVNTIHAMAGSRACFLASCNKMDTLPPEFRRRFGYGIWFFDLPTPEEKEAVWAIHTRGRAENEKRPDDGGWASGDIRNCVRIARTLNCNLCEAAEWVVPTMSYAAEAVEAMRQLADGRFLSASRKGMYRKDADDESVGRRIRKRV